MGTNTPAVSLGGPTNTYNQTAPQNQPGNPATVQTPKKTAAQIAAEQAARGFRGHV